MLAQSDSECVSFNTILIVFMKYFCYFSHYQAWLHMRLSNIPLTYWTEIDTGYCGFELCQCHYGNDRLACTGNRYRGDNWMER